MNTKLPDGRRSRLYGFIPLAIAGLTISFIAEAQPIPMGNQVFVDLGVATADTGNIITATTYTIGDLVSTGNNSGVFAGMPTQSFGSITFNPDDPTSLTFSNDVFGSFTSTFIESFPAVVGSNGASTHVFFVLGDWTLGTVASGFTGGPFEAQFTITFSQTPAVIGLISSAATFATPVPATIPEPASWSLLGISLVGIAGVVYRRRKRARVPDQAGLENI